MRVLPLAAVLGAALFSIAAGQAQAAPAAFDRGLAASRGPIIAVNLRCDHLRCIDPQTGAYTHSGCNRRGCYPISGVVGYTNPRSLGYGYGSSSPPRDWRWRHRRDRDWNHWR